MTIRIVTLAIFSFFLVNWTNVSFAETKRFQKPVQYRVGNKPAKQSRKIKRTGDQKATTSQSRKEDEGAEITRRLNMQNAAASQTSEDQGAEMTRQLNMQKLNAPKSAKSASGNALKQRSTAKPPATSGMAGQTSGATTLVAPAQDTSSQTGGEQVTAGTPVTGTGAQPSGNYGKRMTPIQQPAMQTIKEREFTPSAETPAPEDIPPKNREDTRAKADADTRPNGDRYNFELRGYYWHSTLDSSVRVDSGDYKGTNIDLANDLGLDKTKGLIGAEMTLKFYDRHKIRADYMSLGYSGSSAITSDIVFNGVTYPASSTVRSESEMKSARVGYEYDIAQGDAGFFGIRACANFISGKASLITNEALSNSASITVVAPIVGLTGRLNFSDYISGTIDVAGIGFQGATVFDGTAYMDINPISNIGITGGWRVVQANVDTDGKKAEIRWNGPFGGLIVRF